LPMSATSTINYCQYCCYWRLIIALVVDTGDK
jgi:hypothetical protein